MSSSNAPRIATLRPEQLARFRQGQLLVLMDVARDVGVPDIDIERVSYYDFFAANPFLIFSEPGSERTRLLLAGYGESLSYQSSAQRYSNRRSRLRIDLAVLATMGLIQAAAQARKVTYSISPEGERATADFKSLYVHTYRQGAEQVIATLKRLSDRRLRESAREWLQAKDLLIDIYDLEPDL